jgi:hypothetical protein
MYLTVAMSLKSSGSAFTGVVDTGESAASEGTDDLDLLLNALLTSIAFYPEAETLAGTLTPAQWRTVLGFMNGRDFDGTLKNSFSVPSSVSSAAAYKVIIPFPVSLEQLFEDGNIFSNGSQRLMTGRFEYQVGASLTPSVVLANGTAAVSAFSLALTAETGAGTEADVGNLWKVVRSLNLPTVWQFSDQIRVGLLDTNPVATNPVTTYNITNYDMWGPSDFGGKYQAERLNPTGYDVTARCTPVQWIEPKRTIQDFAAYIGQVTKVDATSGSSSLSFYDIVVLPTSALAVQRVSQQVGAGGSVDTSHPSPKSLPPGSAVPGALQSFLPVRIAPAGTASGGGSVTTHSNAQSAGASALAKQANTARTGQAIKIFRPSR